MMEFKHKMLKVISFTPKDRIRKLKPLVTNYSVLTWLCVCPPEEPISCYRQVAYISLLSSIFSVNAMIIVCSLLFFCKTAAIDLGQSLYSFGQIVGFFSLTYLIIVTLILRGKITELFNSLSRIYEKSKSFHLFYEVSLEI